MKEKNNGTLFGKAEWVSWWMEYLGRFQGQKPKGRRTKGFWPKDLPRDSIHHDSLSKVFPYNIISFSSQTSTSREEFISANALGSIMVNIQGMMPYIQQQQKNPEWLKQKFTYLVFKRMLWDISANWCSQSFPLGPAPRPGRVMLLMCVSICMFVCLSPPPPEAWTFRYILDTLDL